MQVYIDVGNPTSAFRTTPSGQQDQNGSGSSPRRQTWTARPYPPLATATLVHSKRMVTGNQTSRSQALGVSALATTPSAQ